MTDRKISELTNITGANVDDANDEIAIVDASANETKAITRAELFSGVSSRVGIGTSSPSNALDVNSGDSNVVASFRSTDPGAQIRFFDDTTAYNFNSVGVKGDDVFLQAGDNIEFNIQDSEAMRIDSSGNLLVGTTTLASGTTGGASFQVKANDRRTLRLASTSTNSLSLIEFYNSNGLVGFVATSGTATSYNTSSDYRLKEDVQTMVGASDRVLALNPVNFAWKATGIRVDGFLAHEAQQIVPEAVTGDKDGEEMQAIDQSKLVPLLTAALQEALKRIKALEGDPE